MSITNTFSFYCLITKSSIAYLHWNYNRKTNTVAITFRHSGAEWISWAINPTRQTMAGLQAVVAYQNSTMGAMYVYMSPIDTTDTTLPKGSLSFGVPSINAMFENGEMAIFALLELVNGWVTKVKQVWQMGPMSCGRPSIHPMGGVNVRFVGTLSFISGTSTGNPKQRRKNVHGVLNAVNWGMLMPLGAMIARYIKAFKSADPTWFNLHATCQTDAYGIGVAGCISSS